MVYLHKKWNLLILDLFKVKKKQTTTKQQQRQNQPSSNDEFFHDSQASFNFIFSFLFYNLLYPVILAASPLGLHTEILGKLHKLSK